MTDKTLTSIVPIYTRLGIYELSFNDKNHRKISKKGFERLKSKIVQNVYEPIKIWKKNNVVLSGNQRLAVIRHLVENENYDIKDVEVAIYDVDERTARFIQLADNEHDGQYDMERLIEDLEELDEMKLLDIIDPKIVKKLTASTREEEDISDVGEEEFRGSIDEDITEIYITSVPKSEMYIFNDAMDRIKAMGFKTDWKCLKGLILASQQLTDNQIVNLMRGK